MGARRRGNFLPMLDSYDIPFDTIKGFEGRSRVIYEYDPADVLDTYLYPAAARTFRKAGFTWVTQFAYDPIDMARFNSEYQTHFLNMAYTPGKAIGMMIAAEAMRQIPKGKDFGKYPVDTVFGPFTVSARRNLAMLNDGTKYYHTNTTDELPVKPKKLEYVAGTGSSPIVKTDGNGAYFLDRLDHGVWRLEVMPDVILTADPFAKPSLDRTVGVVSSRPVKMIINPAMLNINGPIYYKSVGLQTDSLKKSVDGAMEITPGVYLLAGGKDAEKAIGQISADATFGPKGNMRIREYVKPESNEPYPHRVLLHEPPVRIAKGSPLTLTATWAGESKPDSIVVYPAAASFWSRHNPLFKMEKYYKNTYAVTIDADVIRNLIHNKDWDLRYRIVAFDRDGSSVTYPAGVEGTPLSWDFASVNPDAAEEYVVKIDSVGAPVELLRAMPDMDGSEFTTVPECWAGVGYGYESPMGRAASMVLEMDGDARTDMAVVTKYVAPVVGAYATDNAGYDMLRVFVGDIEGEVKVGLVNADGFTYTACVEKPLGSDVVDIPLTDFVLDATILSPAPYPIFLRRTFEPDPSTASPLIPAEIETLTIGLSRKEHEPGRVEIRGVQLISSEK